MARRTVLCTAFFLLVTASPVIAPTVEAASNKPDRVPLLAQPAAPPPVLSSDDRIPPLANLDEDGLRNPEPTPLTLPEIPLTEQLPQGFAPVPGDGGPTFDVFAIGDPGTTHAAVVQPDQVNIEDADGEWNEIGLVEQPGEGWVGVIAPGTVYLPQQLVADTPIRVTFAGGTITAVPDGAPTAASSGGLVADTEDSVVYPDVLPATDFVYTLAPRGYKELVVLKDPSAPQAISWSITAPGMDAVIGSSGEIDFLRAGQIVALIPPPEAWDSSASPLTTQGSYSLSPTGNGEFSVELSLDPSFLASATYPVTVDPGSQLIFGQGNDDTYVDSANPDTDYRSSWLQVANGGAEKRAFVRFDTAPFQRDDRIMYSADLNLYVWDGPGSGPMIDVRRVTQAWPSPLTWNTQPPVNPTVLDSANCGICLGWMSFELKEMYQHVLQSDISDPWTDDGVRASTEGSATYVFRSAESAGGPLLQLSWNDLPSAPNLDRPANGYVSEDDTPTLKIEGGAQWPNDPNGDDVLVQFQISDDAADFTGNHLIWESPWLDSRSYVVPSGILTDGQTFYWRARSWDVCSSLSTYQMCSYTDGLGVDHERKTSPVRSFTVVLKHLGEDERWAMWSHTLGNGMDLKVNEANGNLFLDVPLDSLATPVGDLGIGLSYNSQQDADYGLSPGWDLAIGAAGQMRNLPVELVKLSDYPNNGVKIRFGGGRTSYFPHKDHHVFATVTAGAGTVRENADGGYIFVSPEGDRYEFAQSGRLVGANPVTTTLASGANAIRYTYDGNGHLEKVTDPLGRRVDLVWSGGHLGSISTWAGQSWTLGYNPSNGRMNTISVTVRKDAADPGSPTHTETVAFSYITGAQLPGGLLDEVDDAVTQASGAAGWTVEYAQDTNNNWRVSQLTPPPGGGPQPLRSWTFQYLGEIKGSTAATACVTDPLGTPDTSPPITCDQAHQTIVDLNWAALPIRIAGPADQTGYWPVRTLIWDSNNNLLCRREPAANATTMITGPTQCQNDKLSTTYTYESEAPFRLLTTTDPSAKPDGSSDRLRHTYQYDSDTNGANFNGLWIEKYENPNLTGIPADESGWSNFDTNWGTGSPPGLSSTDNFSLRWTGLINTNSWSGSDIRKVWFRITSEEGVSLVIENKVLLDCLGTTQPAGTYNCGTNQDVKKWLTPNSLHPITIEYSDLTGPASFKLEWMIQNYQTSFGQIPTAMLQTNLGLLTRKEEVKVGNPNTSLVRTQYSFPDDAAKARHIPDSVALTDLDTSVVRKTAYTYNSYGQVRTKTTAAATQLAATTTYTYTNAAPISCMSSVQEPDGAITNTVCNGAGDVTSSTQIVRAVAGTLHTTQQSRVTATTYDTLGRVTKVTTPWGGETSTSYDVAGRPQEIDRYLGTGAGHDAHAFTNYVYDDAGHLVLERLPEVADPANPGQEVRPEITHVWDWLDDEVSTTDVRHKQWDRVYDAYRRLVQTDSPSGLITNTEYRLSTAPQGGPELHQVTTWSSPGQSGGVPTVTVLNLFDEPRWTQVGTLAQQSFLYDVQNRMFRSTDPAGVQTNYTFNGFGDTKAMTEFYGSGSAATTLYTYDAAGRLQKTDGPRSSPVDDSISYAYDQQGRLQTATQNGITLPGGSSPGAVTTYLWNDADERIQVSQQLSTTQAMVRNWKYDPTNGTSVFANARGTTTSTHDLSGQVTSVADPRGITLNFEYDNLGRRMRRYALQPGVSDDQTFGYDLAGNLISAKVVASGTTIEADYDDEGRLWKVYQASYPTPTTTYAYDPSTGRLSSVADPAGTTSYAYNANGLLSEITDPFSATHVIYTYDTAGRVTKRTDGSGLCWTQSYESGSGRPDVRRIRQGGPTCTGTIHATFDLGYDAASNVTSRAETITGNSYGGSYTYGYDGANRLTNVTGPAAFGSRTYGYDGGGNRTTVQIGTGNPVTTTYDGAGLPTASSDNTSFTHDAIGELTKIDRTGGTANDWNFKYDSWGNLKSAARKTTGTPDVTYTADALDRTLSRTAGAATAFYTYQGTGEILAKSIVGTTTATYAHTPGGPLAQRIGSTTRYYLRDQHGDTVGWANTAGGLAGTALYDPWGQLLSATGEMGTFPTEGTFRFQSDLTDSLTGQVDMMARLYDPALGRFSTTDTLLGDFARPLSLNQYAYGIDNPISNDDPTGLCANPGVCPPPPSSTREEQHHWYAVGNNIREAQSEAIRDYLAHPVALDPPTVSSPPVIWEQRERAGFTYSGDPAWAARLAGILLGREALPGNFLIGMSATLQYRGGGKHSLEIVTVIDPRNLNTGEGGFVISGQNLIYQISNARGQRLLYSHRDPNPPLSKYGYQGDPNWLFFERAIAVPRSFGKPTSVSVAAIVYGHSALPIRGDASVAFGPPPIGPFP